MAIYTEAEARTKRAFDDCGNIIGTQHSTIYQGRACIASDCIAWIFDDNELQRYAQAVTGFAAEWKEFSPGRAYAQENVPKPEGENIGWQRYAPNSLSDSSGWWTRPNPSRRGHCGRVLLTAVLEAP